jgi:TonB-linked SusC/RagA family outer membrane protein
LNIINFNNYKMTKYYQVSICLALCVALNVFTAVVFSQEPEIKVKGEVLESGTELPLKQAIISVIATGDKAETNEAGQFEIVVPDLQTEIIVNLPGFDRRRIYLNGKDTLKIYMVSARYKSLDDEVFLPLGTKSGKNLLNSVSTVELHDINKSPVTSLDQSLQGRIAGIYVVTCSGFPGQKAWLDIGGVSSIYCKNDPLLIIDGMIHETNYADYGIIDGFSLNPMDILDIEDVANISVIKGGQSYWGSNSSNGIIYINSEQKSETSSAISFSMYGGIGLLPAKLDVLNADQFKGFFREQLTGAGYSADDIAQTYPWLDGDINSQDYFKYSNNTDWQDELFQLSAFQKYHIFLKGGDDIATYNISSGYLKHQGIYENAKYSRYNLRINGKINITDRFAVIPNVKLSLADSYLANMGPEEYDNPVLAAILKSPLMTPMARDPATGQELTELDDVGVFNVSNPIAIVREGIGSNRNYHFLSSVDAQYSLSDKILISSLTGLDFNNCREALFLPDIGLVDQEFADNSRHDLVYEFRSIQNHSKISYTLGTKKGNNIYAVIGLRYQKNSYKFDEGNDLNTPSDDFRNLGQGAKYQYLRTTIGDDRGLVWMSYYGVIDYSIKDKYYINANVSYDGTSNLTSKTRYNLYPSVSLAWRVSSEKPFASVQKLADLKLRASYGISGNMHSSVYDYSKLFYIGRRWDIYGVILRDAIPNPDLEIEKKSTINAGIDIALNSQLTNLHFDYYNSTVGNLVIDQELPNEYGFKDYYDNGGVLNINAYELSFDSRIHRKNFTWSYGFTVSRYDSKVKELDFINQSKTKIIYDVTGAQYVTEKGEALNMFYGYKTNGTYSDDNEAASVTGPNGLPMTGGDVRFVDLNSDNIIDENDKTIIGNPNPDLYGGLFTTLTIKKFEFSALFTYSIGNDIFNYVRLKAESMDRLYNQLTAINDRWTSSNTGTDMPKAVYGDYRGNTTFSDRWVEDGSFMRLKEITIAYIPPKFSKLYRDLTVFVTASNLYTLTKYTGYDPEFFYQNNLYYMGIDYGKIPITRSVIAGIKLEL